MKACIETSEIIWRINAGESEAQIARSIGVLRATISDRLTHSSVKPTPPANHITIKEFAARHGFTVRGIDSLIVEKRLPYRWFKGERWISRDAFPACTKCGKPRKKHEHFCSACIALLKMRKGIEYMLDWKVETRFESWPSPPATLRKLREQVADVLAYHVDSPSDSLGTPVHAQPAWCNGDNCKMYVEKCQYCIADQILALGLVQFAGISDSIKPI